MRRHFHFEFWPGEMKRNWEKIGSNQEMRNQEGLAYELSLIWIVWGSNGSDNVRIKEFMSHSDGHRK